MNFVAQLPVRLRLIDALKLSVMRLAKRLVSEFIQSWNAVDINGFLLTANLIRRDAPPSLRYPTLPPKPPHVNKYIPIRSTHSFLNSQ